jgi:hypothetical protein
MVIGLCYGITGTKFSYTLAIGLDNLLIERRKFHLQPTDEGRAEIETEGGVIIEEIENLSFFINDPGIGVGSITFEGNPLIPVVEGMGTCLGLNRFKPRILPRRLIKMAVNRDINVFHFGGFVIPKSFVSLFYIKFLNFKIFLYSENIPLVSKKDEKD